MLGKGGISVLQTAIFYIDVSQTFTFDTFLSIFKQSLFHKTWILKLKSFIQIGTFIFHKKFLKTRDTVNFLDEIMYSTSIYH